MKQKLVIIGNGMAPGRALERLFELAPDAYDVTIFNAEQRVNYDRIMLSPVLSGEKSFEDIIIHGDGWYIEHGITLYKGHKVVAVDRAAKTVTSAHGAVETYDKLVFATGSNPIVIPVPGHDLAGVLTYRDLDDVDAMLLAAKSKGRAVVIGGGLLGLEAAAGLALQGMTVTVIHLMPTLMERQLDPAAGYLLQKELERRGIEVRCKANTQAILATEGAHPRVRAVRLDDGTELARRPRGDGRRHPAEFGARQGGRTRPLAAGSSSIRRCRHPIRTSMPSANVSRRAASASASSHRSTRWQMSSPSSSLDRAKPRSSPPRRRRNSR